MGQAPTGSGSNAGYSVVVSSSDPADAEPVPQKSEAQAASDNREAVANASMVILAVPFPALEVTDELAEKPRGKIVIDVTRLDPSVPPATIDGSSAAERFQAMLPRVVSDRSLQHRLSLPLRPILRSPEPKAW